MRLLHVHKVGDRWLWECYRCQAGEYLRTQRAAVLDAVAHLPHHVGFGFQGPQCSTPTPASGAAVPVTLTFTCAPGVTAADVARACVAAIGAG